MGHTIQGTTVTVFIGNYIRRVNVIKGSLYSRVYGPVIKTSLQQIHVYTVGDELNFTFCFCSTVVLQ